MTDVAKRIAHRVVLPPEAVIAEVAASAIA
jgi:hypothetical protein